MEADIQPDTWVYVHEKFRGRVVRIRPLNGIKWFDIEICGVIIPYMRDEITPE